MVPEFVLIVQLVIAVLILKHLLRNVSLVNFKQHKVKQLVTFVAAELIHFLVHQAANNALQASHVLLLRCFLNNALMVPHLLQVQQLVHHVTTQ